MKKNILIEGMSCGHCVKHVEKVLGEVAGVNSVSVDLIKKSAFIEVNNSVTDSELKNAVEEAGYTVVEINNL